MTILMVGSEALRRNIEFFGLEYSVDFKPKDLDLVGPRKEISRYLESNFDIVSMHTFYNGKKLFAKTKCGLIIETELAWEDSSARQLIELADTEDLLVQDGMKIASVDILYMLKMSHRYLKDSPFFHKTMRDILALREIGATIPNRFKSFYDDRCAETYNYKHPNLNQGKDTFFSNDGVNYIYDHDSIHEAVKHLDMPAYKYYQDPISPVKVSREIFDSQDEMTKLYGVLEEAYVLALERSQIAHPGKCTPRVSFAIALRKICTSITSGWFREFSWENFSKIESLYSDNYIEKFDHALTVGIIKPYNRSE